MLAHNLPYNFAPWLFLDGGSSFVLVLEVSVSFWMGV